MRDMHFETDGDVFVEAKVRNKIQSRGEEGGDKVIKHVMDIPFTAKMHASYILPRLAVQEDSGLLLMCHGADGHVRRIGMKEIPIDREYKDYRMTISFSLFDQEKTAETFLTDLIKVTKLIPEEDHMFTVEFTVQLHPYKADDIGNLHKKGIEIGIKQCFLQFEEQQKDLANAA